MFRIKVLLSLLLTGLILAGCKQQNLVLEPDYSPGEIVEIQDMYGTYFIFAPEVTDNDTKILVIIHGTPAKEGTAVATALSYIERWVNFSEENNLALIAPAFSEKKFQQQVWRNYG